MPIVAPQYGITPDRKKDRETQEFLPADGDAQIQESEPKRPHFWYPKDLPIPEDIQPRQTPASSAGTAAAASRHVTVEVRKRRVIPK